MKQFITRVSRLSLVIAALTFVSESHLAAQETVESLIAGGKKEEEITFFIAGAAEPSEEGRGLRIWKPHSIGVSA